MKIAIKNSIDASFQWEPTQAHLDRAELMLGHPLTEADILTPTQLRTILTEPWDEVASDRVLARMARDGVPEGEGIDIVWLSRRGPGRMVYASMPSDNDQPEE